MHLKTKTLALSASLAMAACSSNQHSAEEAVRQSLKDPESARFGAFYYNSTTKKACLTTNAKNEMGGYTGNKEVHLTRDDSGWTYVGDEEESSADCKEGYADKP